MKVCLYKRRAVQHHFFFLDIKTSIEHSDKTQIGSVGGAQTVTTRLSLQSCRRRRIAEESIVVEAKRLRVARTQSTHRGQKAAHERRVGINVGQHRMAVGENVDAAQRAHVTLAQLDSSWTHARVEVKAFGRLVPAVDRLANCEQPQEHAGKLDTGEGLKSSILGRKVCPGVSRGGRDRAPARRSGGLAGLVGWWFAIHRGGRYSLGQLGQLLQLGWQQLLGVLSTPALPRPGAGLGALPRLPAT